jgi:hypothetical protein
VQSEDEEEDEENEDGDEGDEEDEEEEKVEEEDAGENKALRFAEVARTDDGGELELEGTVALAPPRGTSGGDPILSAFFKRVIRSKGPS